MRPQTHTYTRRQTHRQTHRDTDTHTHTHTDRRLTCKGGTEAVRDEQQLTDTHDLCTSVANAAAQFHRFGALLGGEKQLGKGGACVCVCACVCEVCVGVSLRTWCVRYKGKTQLGRLLVP